MAGQRSAYGLLLLCLSLLEPRVPFCCISFSLFTVHLQPHITVHYVHLPHHLCSLTLQDCVLSLPLPSASDLSVALILSVTQTTSWKHFNTVGWLSSGSETHFYNSLLLLPFTGFMLMTPFCPCPITSIILVTTSCNFSLSFMFSSMTLKNLCLLHLMF